MKHKRILRLTCEHVPAAPRSCLPLKKLRNGIPRRRGCELMRMIDLYGSHWIMGRPGKLKKKKEKKKKSSLTLLCIYFLLIAIPWEARSPISEWITAGVTMRGGCGDLDKATWWSRFSQRHLCHSVYLLFHFVENPVWLES